MAVDRIKQWDSFDEQVRRHITQYTIVQYGNPDGDEQVDAVLLARYAYDQYGNGGKL